jgi:transposase
MTKDKSHRQLFVSKVLNDHFSVKDAAIHCNISYNTGRNWMRMLNRIGNYYPLRHRRSIPGVMSLDHQEILQMVISNNRMAMIDEITQSMSEETGFHYSPRLIRQVMSRHKYVSRLANELSPLERDNELRRYYREQVMHPGGNFTSTQLVFVDECSKKLGNATRKRAWRVKGDKVSLPVIHSESGNAASLIASMTVRGIQSVSVIDVVEEGNVNGDRFMEAFVNDILVYCEPYPGRCSVIVMDNAAVHMKLLISAACQERGVIVIYLPPYSFDFNPIELVFNTALSKLLKVYGRTLLPPNSKIGDLFRDCLLNCLTPDKACNMFEKCHISISVQDREWANV